MSLKRQRPAPSRIPEYLCPILVPFLAHTKRKCSYKAIDLQQLKYSLYQIAVLLRISKQLSKQFGFDMQQLASMEYMYFGALMRVQDAITISNSWIVSIGGDWSEKNMKRRWDINSTDWAKFNLNDSNTAIEQRALAMIVSKYGATKSYLGWRAATWMKKLQLRAGMRMIMEENIMVVNKIDLSNAMFHQSAPSLSFRGSTYLLLRGIMKSIGVKPYNGMVELFGKGQRDAELFLSTMLFNMVRMDCRKRWNIFIVMIK
jgi:hypothetical protein